MTNSDFSSALCPALLPLGIALAALAVDRLAGEPPNHWHPLVAFGRIASGLERALRSVNVATWSLRIAGILAVALLLAPITLGAWVLSSTAAGPLFDVVLLYLAIAPRSLEEHAMRIVGALRESDLAKAREAVAMIVSRDTTAMTEEDVARAGVESVLENGNDAVFGALFWFMVLGAPGAVLYRLANTLDAMWGYKNEAYLQFGRAAARFDDLLNFVPARLTAFTYSVLGKTRSGLRCWHEQAHTWYSPNAGPVMAAGAGALEVRLGGAASYEGKLEPRPLLGCGNAPGWRDIERAVALERRGLFAWMGVFALFCIARTIL